jgi:VWFA-related protein
VRTAYVDVFVTHEGQSVIGLTAADFEVFDSGVRQDVELVNIETVPMSAMLLLDTSSSVYGRKLRHLRDAAHAFLDELRDVDEAGLVTFTNQWTNFKQPGSDIADLHKTLNQPVTGGPTALLDTLYASLKLLDSRSGRPVVLVFTDGRDNASWLEENDLMEAAKQSEAIVHVVVIQQRSGVTVVDRDVVRGAYIDPRIPGGVQGQEAKGGTMHDLTEFLEDISNATGGRFWYAKSSAELKDIYLSILDDMKGRYLLTYDPRGVPKRGWHPLEVKLKKGKSGEIRARSGYMVSGSPN